MRGVPAIGSPDAEWPASEKRACANAREGLQPGVPSCTGPGQPNEICVFPASWPVAVIVGFATLTAGPMHAIAALPIVTSLRKSRPLTRPAQATAVAFNSDVRAVRKIAFTRRHRTSLAGPQASLCQSTLKRPVFGPIG